MAGRLGVNPVTSLQGLGVFNLLPFQEGTWWHQGDT